mmetsp:Transcript_20384/g.28120  ORF Transcript_20384/g.28120 Transcript_20384/m.28120 type:complete len:161 (+) Transcript_20384:157-639(+)
MGFLEDPNKLVTFSANAPVQLSWTNVVTGSVQYSSNYKYTADDDTEPVDVKDETDIFGFDFGGETKYAFNPIAGNDIRVGRQDFHHDDSHTRTVSVTLSDADNGDYFAVRVTQDQTYGTPIFTTMGGQSKCPGETGTSRRESEVKIIQIIPRCGPTKSGL